MNDFEQRIRSTFPNMQYGEFKEIDNRQERFAIDDLSYRFSDKKLEFQELIELFVLACKGFVYVQEATNLARSMNRLLEEKLSQLDPERSVLIFPGSGSQAVKDLMPKEVFNYFPSLNLEVCRVVSPDMSINRVDVKTGKNVIRQLLPIRIETCVIVDDVLASGSTTQAIRDFIDPRKELNWYTSVWMALSPLQSKQRKQPDEFQSGLPGFNNVFTSLVYQGKNGIPANNSLSSFAQSGVKANAVIDGYKRKYVEDEETFDSAINQLRGLYE